MSCPTHPLWGKGWGNQGIGGAFDRTGKPQGGDIGHMVKVVNAHAQIHTKLPRGAKMAVLWFWCLLVQEIVQYLSCLTHQRPMRA